MNLLFGKPRGGGLDSEFVTLRPRPTMQPTAMSENSGGGISRANVFDRCSR